MPEPRKHFNPEAIMVKNKAFTILEAVVSMAVVAIGVASVVTLLRTADNAAYRVRAESRAAAVFSAQSDWLVGMPFANFESYAGLATNATYGPSGAGGETRLIFPADEIDVANPTNTAYHRGYLIQNVSVTAASANAPQLPYSISVAAVAKDSGGGVATNMADVEHYSVTNTMLYVIPPMMRTGTSETNTLSIGFEKYP